MYLANHTESNNPLCSGCNKRITSYRRIYKTDFGNPLIFCKTCCNHIDKHIDKHEGIFSATYSNGFDIREQLVSKNY